MKTLLRTIFASVILAVLSIVSDAHASDDMPASLVAQLAMKVASYDRNHAERVKTRPRVLVYENASDDRSVRIATMLVQSLRDPEIGKGAPIELVVFTSASEVATAVDSRSASIVILATGLEENAGAIAGSLAGKDVLTIGTTGVLAERGTVVGFELREGKPKIVVNLARAQAQHVSLKAELLNLARIIQ